MFTMSLPYGSQEYEIIKTTVNQGIDSRLTAFIKSSFNWEYDRLECAIVDSEIEILIRRLVELDEHLMQYDDYDSSVGSLLDSIISVHYGYEAI